MPEKSYSKGHKTSLCQPYPSCCEAYHLTEIEPTSTKVSIADKEFLPTQVTASH